MFTDVIIKNNKKKQTATRQQGLAPAGQTDSVVKWRCTNCVAFVFCCRRNNVDIITNCWSWSNSV